MPPSTATTSPNWTKPVILDERFNGGGSVADYVIDLLNRPLLSYWATREGKIFSTPAASIFGPKVMVINEFAGSGGDAMPQFFGGAAWASWWANAPGAG